MSGQNMWKTDVSVLFEFCAKNKLASPAFEFFVTQNGFTCRVTLENSVAEGCGLSKRNAKHAAAQNMLDLYQKKLSTANHKKVPKTDFLASIKKLSIHDNHPLPLTKLVKEDKYPPPSTLPKTSNEVLSRKKSTLELKKSYEEVTSRISPASPLYPDSNRSFQFKKAFDEKINCDSLYRKGSSSQIPIEQNEKKAEKKETKVKPPLPYSSNGEKRRSNVKSLDEALIDMEEKNRQKFQKFRKDNHRESNLFSSGKLSDRHNYFSKFSNELKNAAFQIIASKDYDSSESKAMAIISALQLQSSISLVNGRNSLKPFFFIELNCDYDACFAGNKPQIFDDIIDYFDIMLR